MPLRLFKALVLGVNCIWISACSVNGVGFGFDVQQQTSELGTREHITGVGVLLDTRGPTRSISIGVVDRFLLCPVSKSKTATPLFEGEVKSSQDFQPELCAEAWSYSQQRTGLSLDFSLEHLRLLIGRQQRNVLHINKGVSSTFHLLYNSEEKARGTAILYPTKEVNNESVD